MKVKTISPIDLQSYKIDHLLDHLYDTSKPNFAIAPYADKVFLVEIQGTIQGVAVGYINPYHHDYYLLGNYECKEDKNISEELMKAVTHRAIVMGKNAIIGPMNGSTWYGHRFSDPASQPFFLEAIHKPYYMEQWASLGFEQFQSYHSNIEILDASMANSDTTTYFSSKGLEVVSFDIVHPVIQLENIYTFCNSIFSHNHLFSPISKAQFLDLYLPLSSLLDPTLIDIVLDNNEVVGLLFSVPDIYDSTAIVVKTLARHPSPRYKGMAHMLANRFINKAVKAGYKRAVHAYIHDSNSSERISANCGGEFYKRHYLLKKDL